MLDQSRDNELWVEILQLYKCKVVKNPGILLGRNEGQMMTRGCMY